MRRRHSLSREGRKLTDFLKRFCGLCVSINQSSKKKTTFSPFAWQKELISNHAYVSLMKVIAFHTTQCQGEPWQCKWSWHTISSSIVLGSPIHKVLSVICHSAFVCEQWLTFCHYQRWPEPSEQQRRAATPDLQLMCINMFKSSRAEAPVCWICSLYLWSG